MKTLRLCIVALAVLFSAMGFGHYTYAEEIKHCDDIEDISPRVVPITNQAVNDAAGTFTYHVKLYIGGDAGWDEVDECQFTLSTGESYKFWLCDVPDYYYTVTQLPQDDWELVSLNGEEGIDTLDTFEGNCRFSDNVFLNKRLTEDPPIIEPTSEPEIAEEVKPTEEIQESEITVPDTGKNTASFSATKTGIIAFAIIATISRIIYLIHKYNSRT